MGKHSAPNVAQHWPSVLGLRDDGTPYIAHACESGCGLARPGDKALLVAWSGRDHNRGTYCHLLVLHPDHAVADGSRGSIPSGGQWGTVSVATPRLRATRSHSVGMASSTEGVLVAEQEWRAPDGWRIRRS